MCKEDLCINALVETANKGDRLQLLNDPSAPVGNLDNVIHPIFHDANFLEKSVHLSQAIRLASLFLQYDSVLGFFIPLAYGRHQTDSQTRKVYLTNPVASKTEVETQRYILGVRRALHCLEHCVIFRWVGRTGSPGFWARARQIERRPPHTEDCFRFKYEKSVTIELSHKLMDFYQDETTGYRKQSRCAQFRHDFQLAVTLVHEIVHAFGIMLRGHLKEPHVRLDHADTSEWGYAWENFMFGAIINPQDRDYHGTYIHLGKTWADHAQARRYGGKEYYTIPVSWTAQWFRKKTWERIEKEGPVAIKPPIIQVKFVLSSKYKRWIIMTDVAESYDDFERLHNDADRECLRDKSNHDEVKRALWSLIDSESLQTSNVPIPTRIPPKTKFLAVTGPSAPERLSVAAGLLIDVSTQTSRISTPVSSLPLSRCLAKRPRDEGKIGRDLDRPTKVSRR